MKLKSDVLYAIYIGGMCSFSYLTVYIVRNILSAVSPQMLELGALTNEELGTLSSSPMPWDS